MGLSIITPIGGYRGTDRTVGEGGKESAGEGGAEELDAEEGEVDKSSDVSDDDHEGNFNSVGRRLNLGGLVVWSIRRASCERGTVSKRRAEVGDA